MCLWPRRLFGGHGNGKVCRVAGVGEKKKKGEVVGAGVGSCVASDGWLLRTVPVT